MEGKSVITPLTESNYATWKVQVKMNLIKEDLFGFIDCTETTPADGSGDTVVNKYKQRKAKCLAMIVLAVDPKLLYIVGDPEDPLVVWNKLKDTFQRKSWANKLRLRRKLYGMKFSSSQEMSAHLRNFIELFDELSIIGDAIDDEDKVINLLASLPESYSTLVTALEALDKVPSWETVTERLLHEEQKLKCKIEVDTALLARQSSNSKKDYECFYCNKPGHIKKNCRAFKKNIEEKTQQKQKANIVENNDISDNEYSLLASALATKVNIENKYWILDSGATQHMSNDKSYFNELNILATPLPVQVGDGRILDAIGVGTIALQMHLPDNTARKCFLKNVLCVPKLNYNLVSVSQATANKNTFVFSDSDCKVYAYNNKLLAVADKIGKMYMLKCKTVNSTVETVAVCTTIDESLWHKRLCHLGIDGVRSLIKNNMVTGIEGNLDQNFKFCENCCNGKNQRSTFNKIHSNSAKIETPLELVHSDVCGKITPSSLSGGNYFLTFIDEATHYTWIYVIKNKSDVFDCFKEWKALVENQFSCKVKILRTDNGGEYCSNEFENFLKTAGIRHQKTIVKTPEQNGVSERMNRSLMEAVRSMLSDSKLAKSFWAEALSTAVHVRNRCPTTALQNKTPYEALFGVNPDLNHLKVFGCIGYSHIPKDERHKLDS